MLRLNVTTPKVQSGRLYGAIETKVLSDEATRADIIDALDWLDKQVSSCDVGVIYSAGHGLTGDRQA